MASAMFASVSQSTIQTIQAAAVVLSFVAMAVCNGLVTSPALGLVKITNAQVANTHPVYCLPTGATFSVWGIIYLLEALFVVYQAVPSPRGGLREPAFEAIRLPVVALFSLNAIWLFLFGYETFWAAQIVIVLYDVCLFLVLSRLDVNMLSSAHNLGVKLAAAAFSANASWVTVASCLGFQVALLEEGWLPSEDLSVALILVAVAVACAATFRMSDLVYAAIAAWALSGIISNQAEASAFGCNTQICPACLAATIPICSRPDSSARAGQPNGFAMANCAFYNATASTARECFVAKSPKVVGWATAGIVAVVLALVAGLANGVYNRRREHHETPLGVGLVPDAGAKTGIAV